MPRTLKNISLTEFRKFLKYVGCKLIRTSGGHETWSRKDLNRPIVIQSHKKTIPQFVVRNNLNTLGISKEEFLEILDKL